MKKKRIRKIFYEFIPVFAGVILALILSDIKNNIDNRRFINELLDKVVIGTGSNINRIESQIAQNNLVIDSLRRSAEKEDDKIKDVLHRSGGIRFEQFDLAAWNVLRNSNLITDVDYNIVAGLYLLEENLESTKDMFFPIFNNINTESTNKLDKEILIENLEDYNSASNYQLKILQSVHKELSK